MENDESVVDEQDEPNPTRSLFFTVSLASTAHASSASNDINHSTESIPMVDVSNSQGFDQLFDNDILFVDDPDLPRPALQQVPVPLGDEFDISNIQFEEKASSEPFEGI